MAKLLLATLHTIPTTSGAIITATDHSGRLRSCSIMNSMTIANGKTVMVSSNPPNRKNCFAASSEFRKIDGRYHRWLNVVAAKKAAVHLRRRTGETTSEAKALPRRNSR